MQLVIRADTKRGQGHVMRCKVLAEAWEDRGGQAIWDDGQPQVIDTDTWIIMDGSDFTEGEQKRMHQLDSHLLVIDDNAHLPHYDCDVLLNPNAYARSLKYNAAKTTKLLLGPEYALIRREFRDYPLYRTIPPFAHHILVAPGSVATGELQREIRIALGQAECEYRILQWGDDVPAQMAWADLYVGAAGVTTYEAAFMGLPMVVIVTADNQERNAAALQADGLAWNLGKADGLTARDILAIVGWAQGDQMLRRVASETGRKLVDGQGAKRIVEVMLGITRNGR